MICPDIDELIEYGVGRSDDPELQAHVETCEACQADLLTIRALSGAKEAEEGIAPDLVARIISGLPEPDVVLEPIRGGWLQNLVTGALGFLTASAALFITGTAGSAGPRGVLLLGIGFSAVVVVVNLGQASECPPADGVSVEFGPA